MAPSSSPQKFPRYGFYEAMEMSRIAGDDSTGNHPGDTHRFMSHRPAWQPGSELPWETIDTSKSLLKNFTNNNAYGGNVYIQAPLAAVKVVEEDEERERRTSKRTATGKFGLHSIQGVFAHAGHVNRPFIYHVTKLAAGRNFQTCLVNARQPTQPSANPSGPFPESDAKLPLGPICFSCHVTFKRPTPSYADLQLSSAQQRFAAILAQRAPDEWEASPQLDVDMITEVFPNAGHGGFPIVDMYKVDMTAYNAARPIPERRELILYRLHKDVPASDVNAHILCHAFEADRNGLLMPSNYLGWGHKLGKAASLTYKFLVHVNPEDAVIGDGWWIQEVCWPRVEAGRAVLESRIWSPAGKHVASGYQDGIAAPYQKRDGEKL